ncbi:MAG: outer membrane protein assembly factor BamA [Cytophagales bacterium]|nr:outer membrane protein assembly factor BamA [Cytophagales bacterium]
MRLFIKSFVSVFFLFALLGQAIAVEPFAVKDIRVEGLQRVEAGTVFATLPIRTGDTFTDDKGAAAIRALFALGLFKDIRLESKDGVLIVLVEERPTIAELTFVGAKEFDKDVLTRALKDVGLASGRAYDKALADRAEQELKRQYIGKSLYGAQVVTTVTPIERNRVNLTFTVAEGEVAKIRSIRIVGNKSFSESTLRGQFDLDTTGTMSWYTKSDRYTRTKLNADLETLRSYYLTRGYLQFSIDSTQVALSPDKQSVDITIAVTEGLRYVVSAVELRGNYLGKEDEFKALVKIPVGQPYNSEFVGLTTKAFTDLFGKFGFAFARVESLPDIDAEKAQVKIVLAADPSKRAQVRRINIIGNSRTRDEVIRREFRQYEASWYDGDKIKLSRDRNDRLGYFKEVRIETQEVAGAQDQVDVNLTVVEKPTGSLTLGAGFSSTEGLTVQFGIQQDNAFGSGQFLGVNINTSKFNQVYSISTTNPYFTEDGVSRTFALYQRRTRPYTTIGGDYQLTTTGLNVSFGIPINELDRIYLGAGAEKIKIDSGTSIPAAYLAYADTFGYVSNAYPFTLGWSRDSRDSFLIPTKGTYQRVNSALSKGGDAQYTSTTYQFQQYLPINKQLTFALNTELGWGRGLSGRPFPVFKGFNSGGLGSVRGFAQSSLGPRDVTGAYIGGPKKMTLNLELNMPFPGAGNDRSLRLYSFYDAGNVFGENESYNFSKLRSSIGVGLSWISPVGPLRFAIANPVRAYSGDRIEKFQFQIGTAF